MDDCKYTEDIPDIIYAILSMTYQRKKSYFIKKSMWKICGKQSCSKQEYISITPKSKVYMLGW